MSEESRQRTDQLLLTSPLSIAGMVLGKYFAAVGVFLITLLITKSLLQNHKKFRILVDKMRKLYYTVISYKKTKKLKF